MSENLHTPRMRRISIRRGDDGADKASESEIYKGAQTF